MRSTSLLVPSLALLASAACSSADEAAPAPAPAPTEEPTAAAPPPPVPEEPPPPPPFKPVFPTVLSRGGPVIKTPTIIPVLFAGDTAQMKADIASFTKKLAASKYWTDTTAEYGVGPLTAADPIIVQETPAATITSGQIETWLAAKLTGASPAFGQPDPNALYAIFYPAGVTITMDGAGELGQSCEGYGAYHYEIKVGGKDVGYAVHPRCDGLDDLTVAATHEAFEWATDPFPATAPAFSKLDEPHWAWQAAMIGELADLCTFLDLDYPVPAEMGYAVQRLWSNALSSSGSFPCAPKKATPYVQAIAEADDDAYVPDYGTFGAYIKTKAIRVDPGASRKVKVHVYADDASVDPVAVYAMNMEELYQKPSTTGFTYQVTKTPQKPGAVVEVTIGSPAKASMDILMMATVMTNGAATYWPVLITNDDAANAQAGRPSVTPEMMPRVFPGDHIGRGGPRIARLLQPHAVPGR